jgi:hypothetical protein
MASNIRLEIILDVQGTKYFLDTDGIEAMPFIYNVQNLKDISQVKGSYSKTIVVPETTNNRAVFNNITDLNSNSTFNANLRNRAYILVDSICVFEGYFQLTSFSIDNYNYKNTLSLYLFSDTSDFYTVIGEDFIDTLDFSKYNHRWEYSNVVDSWSKDWHNGYFYPLIDYGKNWSLLDINGSTTQSYVPLSMMLPATYMRTIWDAIFSDAGFTWKSNSLETLTPFNNLIIPFNGKDVTNSQNYVDLHGFLVGSTYSASTGQALQLTSDYTNTGHNTYTTQTTSSYIWNVQPGGAYPFTPAGTYYWSDAWSTVANTKVKFAKETPDPLGDPNALFYDYQYTNTESYPVTQRFVFNLTLFLKFRYSTTNPPRLVLKRQYDSSGTYYASGISVPTWDGAPTTNYLNVGRAGAATFNPTVWSYLGYWSATMSQIMPGYFAGVIPGSGAPGSPGYTPAQPWNNYEVYPNHNRLGYTTYYEVFTGAFKTPAMNIQPGEKVWLEFEYPIAGDTLLSGGTTAYYKFPAGYTLGAVVGGPYSQAGSYTASYPLSTMGNEIQTAVVPGNEIIYNAVVPKQIKKRDFIMSIIKMFNLVIEPEKDNPKVLNIEIADYYYSVGTIKDWTSKVDFSQAIDVQVLGDIQNKRFTFKYKDDKDYLNTDYVSAWKKSYGEMQKITESEFAEGEKKIEVIFSPTPMVQLPYSKPTNSFSGTTYSNIIIPEIWTLNNNQAQTTQSNPRILYKKMIALSTSSYWSLQSNVIGATFATTTQAYYPYSGHFNDPGAGMTEDINWAQTDGLYFTAQTVVNNGLYLRYWQKTVEELTDKDSRIVSLMAYLTPQDIYDFKFNDAIYIDLNSPAGGGSGGQYFKVNKIENYDPTVVAPCKVELIRTRSITVPKAYTRPTFGGATTTVPVLMSSTTLSQYSVKASTNADVNTSTVNINSVTTTLVSGTNNTNSASDSLVSGTGNTVAGRQMAVIGSNNTISSETNSSNTVLGSNNQTNANVSNSFIIGNNSTVGDPNDSVLVENAIVIGSNLSIDASNVTYIGGTVLIQNNFVSASRNKILNPFNDNSPINYISGSRNTIRELGSNINFNIVDAGRNKII